jgi:hypothetical protein
MMNETNNIDSILNNNIENRNVEENINKNRNISNLPKESVDNVLPIVIYRFKFTEEFMVYLYNFSKIHQYDDRKDFKEAWNVWTEENDDIIDGEMRRLLTLGYEGDVLDKMFKSARYYFRKKSTERTDPKQRRQYISVTKDLLDAMDRHIENNIYDENYQPKTGFITFCKDNETLLKDTISSIFEQGIKESELIEDKIKKTYKNRYFMLTNK